MFSKTVDNILTILAVTVIADKRVFSAEIDTFVNSVENLTIFADNNTEATRAKLLMWFENHKEDFKARMHESSEFESWYYEIIDTLKDHPDRHAILNRMIKISKADGELHPNEKGLIKQTAKRWNINLST